MRPGFPRGYRKPIRPQVDWGHRLSKGLTNCWLLGDGTGVARNIGSLALDGVIGKVVNTDANAPSHHGGNALNFDNAGSPNTNVVTVTNWRIPAAGALTFAAWIYPRGDGGGNFGRVISKGDVINWFKGNVTAGMTFSVDSSSTTTISSSNKTPTNTWTHVAITYKSGGPAVWYFNGVVDSGAGSYTTAIPAENSQAAIGDRYNAAGDRGFDGYIEGVRTYDRVLPPEEVTLLYAEPYAGIYETAFPGYRNGVIVAASFLPRGLNIQQAVNRASTY